MSSCSSQFDETIVSSAQQTTEGIKIMNETGCVDDRQWLVDRREDAECEPTAKVTSKFNDVRITKVANGFIVKVGCKTFVTKNWQEASNELSEYWKDPRTAEKKYTEQQ